MEEIKIRFPGEDGEELKEKFHDKIGGFIYAFCEANDAKWEINGDIITITSN